MFIVDTLSSVPLDKKQRSRHIVDHAHLAFVTRCRLSALDFLDGAATAVY